VLEQPTFPDFFQEETPDALRSCVDWLEQEIGLDDQFFAKLLKADAPTFSDWRRADGELSQESEGALRQFWHTTLHLLSFLNFDPARVKELFGHVTSECPVDQRSALTPPWSGSSLKEYFEQIGSPAIEKVDCWVTGLRFGDIYAA